MTSFTVRITESGQKLREHSILSLETEKINLLYCRLKLYKRGMEINIWLTVSTNGYLTRSSHNWTGFCFFGSGSGVLDCDWRRFFFRNGDGFWFSLSRLAFSTKQFVQSPPKKIGFLFVERNFQNVAVHFALQTIVTVFIILSP